MAAVEPPRTPSDIDGESAGVPRAAPPNNLPCDRRFESADAPVAAPPPALLSPRRGTIRKLTVAPAGRAAPLPAGLQSSAGDADSQPSGAAPWGGGAADAREHERRPAAEAARRDEAFAAEPPTGLPSAVAPHRVARRSNAGGGVAAATAARGEEAVSMLVFFLDSADPSQQAASALGLAAVADAGAVRGASDRGPAAGIVKSGALPKLTGLLASREPSVAEAAAKALWNLALEGERARTSVERDLSPGVAPVFTKMHKCLLTFA